MRSRRQTADRPDLLGVLAESTALALWHRSGGRAPGRARQRPRPLPRRGSFAQWCVDGYPPGAHPALVVGDAHGASAHLAAALNAPWLPILGDGRLSEPYAALIEQALLPGAPVLVMTAKTAPTDPVMLDVAAIAAHAARTRHPPMVIRAPGPALSAAVAQAYRSWLRAAGKTGDRLVVESGTLLDPWQVLRAGLVPYWCPSVRLRHADALQWWLAGEEPYTSIEVLLQPSGGPSLPGELECWQGAAAFAGRGGVIEPRCRRAYPHRPLPARHARKVLQQHPCDLPVPPPLDPDDALVALAAPATSFRCR
jgi:hypothetical protein